MVHDPFWTATARHADIVLPVTMSIERDDYGSGQNDRMFFPMPALTRPHGEARDDYAIFAGLADRLGAGKDFTEGRTTMDWLRHLYDEWRGKLAERGRAVPGFDEFWASDGLELPVASEPQVAFADFRADPEGRPLTTPTGKIEIFSETIDSYRYPDCPGHPVWREPDEWLGSPAARRFRLQLVANQPRSRLHSQLDIGAHSQSSRSPGVNRCGCILPTQQPAACATATSYGSSTTGVPAWPGWLPTKRYGPGSPSFPPAPGTTRTRPTRAFAVTATPTCSPPTALLHPQPGLHGQLALVDIEPYHGIPPELSVTRPPATA